MSLFSLIIGLIFIGVALWAVNTYIPMDPKVKNIINIVVILVIVVWLLNAFGIIAHLQTFKVPRAN